MSRSFVREKSYLTSQPLLGRPDLSQSFACLGGSPLLLRLLTDSGVGEILYSLTLSRKASASRFPQDANLEGAQVASFRPARPGAKPAPGFIQRRARLPWKSRLSPRPLQFGRCIAAVVVVWCWPFFFRGTCLEKYIYTCVILINNISYF